MYSKYCYQKSLYDFATPTAPNNLICGIFSVRLQCWLRWESESLVACCRTRWRSTWRAPAASLPPFSPPPPPTFSPTPTPPSSPPPPPSPPPPHPSFSPLQASSPKSSSSPSLKIRRTVPLRPVSVSLKQWSGDNLLLPEESTIISFHLCLHPGEESKYFHTKFKISIYNQRIMYVKYIISLV